MLKNNFILSVASLLILVSMQTQAELYTWVDDQGKKHFGDSIPPEYKDQAHIVDVKPLNTVAPEEEVKQQNTKAVKKLKRDDRRLVVEQKRAAEAREKELSEEKEVQSELSRESCRDSTVTVKARTECFNSISQ